MSLEELESRGGIKFGGEKGHVLSLCLLRHDVVQYYDLYIRQPHRGCDGAVRARGGYLALQIPWLQYILMCNLLAIVPESL